MDDNAINDNLDDDEDDTFDFNSDDDSFIENIKHLEKDYKHFYKAKNSSVDLFFLYVGNSEVESVHKSNQMLSIESKLLKGDLNNLIKTHQRMNKTSYKLISLLQYNLTLEPVDVLGMISDDTISDDTINDGEQYLHAIRRIDDIYFANTINFLQDVNALFFVFSRDYTKNAKHAKHAKHAKDTKRIIFNSKYSKTRTRRKKLKDSM